MQREYKRKFSLDSRPVEQMNLRPVEPKDDASTINRTIASTTGGSTDRVGLLGTSRKSDGSCRRCSSL